MAGGRGAIVAIGGGELRLGETEHIDRAIVDLCRRAEPRHLFIPTASGEPEPYIENVARVYDALGCACSALRLKAEPSAAEIEDAVLGADIVYVGGGDTATMLREWRRFGVDRLLERAWRGGAIMSGLSAGSICWFERGLSDSASFGDGADDWDYATIEALGFLPGAHCPHYDERSREGKFRAWLGRTDIDFIGVENRAALVVEGGRFRTLAAGRPDGRMPRSFAVSCRGGSVTETELPGEGPLAELVSLAAPFVRGEAR
ncbi:MAG: Type 1 glutamine amidotransferase-like domain-containing protein [Spirochaetales bacterium]|nr:Type 1 glutamine amidotransferase-like domain-containing protein [Spirochaetales bacterium]